MGRAHEVRVQIDLLLRKQGVDTEVACATGEWGAHHNAIWLEHRLTALSGEPNHNATVREVGTVCSNWKGAGLISSMHVVWSERDVLLRCLAVGLFLNVATRQPPSEGKRGCYKVVATGRSVGQLTPHTYCS
jgi:hypothetical protein